MKKTLVALAVLAASGASMAQSTVTLYGIADVWFGSELTETATATAVTGLTKTQLNSGGVNTSRFGLMGSEDLGGGLKANFRYEQGFAMDTGAASDGSVNGIAPNATAFARQTWVGLSGGFGAVKLGRTTTPYDDVSGATNGNMDSNLAPLNRVSRTASLNGSSQYLARPNNTMMYSTPAFSGVTASASYSLGEDNNTTTNTEAGAVTSFMVQYAGGPLVAHLAYQTEKLAANTQTIAVTGATALLSTVTTVQGVTPTTAKDFTRLGVTYDFGAALVRGTYGKAAGISNVSGREATDYQIGVDVPFGAATIMASYATSEDSGFTAALGNAKRTGYGLAAKYALSKRTFAYGGYETDTTTNAPVALDAKHSLFSVGIQHRF